MKWQNENERENYKKVFMKIKNIHPQLKGIEEIHLIEFLTHYTKFLIQVLVLSNFQFQCKTFEFRFLSQSQKNREKNSKSSKSTVVYCLQ